MFPSKFQSLLPSQCADFIVRVPARLIIQFVLKFSHLQDLDLQLFFQNIGPLPIGDKVFLRTVIETLRSLNGDPTFFP